MKKSKQTSNTQPTDKSEIEPNIKKSNEASSEITFIRQPTWPKAVDLVLENENGQPRFVEFKNFINSTGTIIGSTMSDIDALSGTMNKWNDDAIANLQPGLNKHFAKYIEPIKNELDLKLQETKKSLSRMNDFIKDMDSALPSLFSVQGKMNGLESQMSSVLGRLTKLEEDRNNRWNKTTTIVSIILTVIGILVGYYIGIHK